MRVTKKMRDALDRFFSAFLDEIESWPPKAKRAFERLGEEATGNWSEGRRSVRLRLEEDLMFDEFKDEFLKFERVKEKLSNRPDLHAFILLDNLLPGDQDMVAAAEHDEIYLSPEPEELAKVATKDQLRDLHRCGVRANDHGLCMFA